MKFKLFLTIMALTTIHQSFSMTPNEQQNLNNQLVEAASFGHNTKIASLLQAGAETNTKGNYGWTALHWASCRDHTATVELLLYHGADINVKDNYDLTPLHLAAYNGCTATVELLLSHGPDINAKDNNGEIPLNRAVPNQHTAIIELLNNYQILSQQAQKPTKALLNVAIAHGYYKLVKLLLKRGLIPDESDLQLAKKRWEKAQYKQSYEAIGRLLARQLSLLPKVEGIPVGGISKAGIVGLYGLPKEIAQEIATFCE